MTSKKSGAPITSAGKSAAAVADSEQQAVVLQVAQLSAYYRPQSPLEHLQIQRIARCTAKLDTLFAAEQAKAELALMQCQATDEQIMGQFAHYPASAQSLALKMIQQTEADPPFGLTDTVLGNICHEIDSFVGALETEAHLIAAFPVLHKFLQSTKIKGYDGPFSMDYWLWAVAAFLKAYLIQAQQDSTPLPDEERTSYGRLLLKIHSDSIHKQSILTGVRSPRSDVVPYQSVLQDDFSVFNQLRRCRQQAREIAAQFPRVKALVAASSALPTAEAEQLTQNHASLERQLSRHMAELLQLQAQALARLSI